LRGPGRAECRRIRTETPTAAAASASVHWIGQPQHRSWYVCDIGCTQVKRTFPSSGGHTAAAPYACADDPRALRHLRPVIPIWPYLNCCRGNVPAGVPVVGLQHLLHRQRARLGSSARADRDTESQIARAADSSARCKRATSTGRVVRYPSPPASPSPSV